mmetsp:Transcript_35827/g.76411  ORF Transcript_35827/g.76411 Transcript_35827/m.76411 type:complete len:232 (+) Transcript_35827:360-1055(+)
MVVPAAANIICHVSTSDDITEGHHALGTVVCRNRDIAIPHLQVNRHPISGIADDSEVFLFPEVIRPTHRHIRLQGPVLCWVNDIRTDPIANEVELLGASKPDFHLNLIETRSVEPDYRLHRKGLEVVPRADHGVTMPPTILGSFLQRAFIDAGLPRYLLLSSLRVKVEKDHVHRTLGDIVPSAIDLPEVPRWCWPGAQDPAIHATGHVCREKLRIAELVHADVEALNTSIT